jgi:hypothetical protein
MRAPVRSTRTRGGRAWCGRGRRHGPAHRRDEHVLVQAGAAVPQQRALRYERAGVLQDASRVDVPLRGPGAAGAIATNTICTQTQLL